MSIPKIHPAFWFDNNAAEAAKFYCSVFENGKIISESPVTVSFELDGYYLLGINGGPMFKPNASISLYVECDTVEEIDHKFAKLSEGGMVMMPLDKYPWTARYAFIQDKFGIAWQLSLRAEGTDNQKITPSLLFVNEKNGKAEEAVKLYTSTFKNGKSLMMAHYGKEDRNVEGHVLFSLSEIDGFKFSAMDGPGNHQFDFSEGISFVVRTENQEETDYFWEKLTANGGKESRCGWLKDPFGVSWQIVPKRLMELMSSGNAEQSKKVMEAMMPMNKLIIADLEKAAES
jgi:predicted 3-demethylubiquinone-9 3-methyltransferase (glyoxalase superfamily)